MLLASFLAVYLQAQSRDITVDELINNYLEAIGGVENWQKIESMTFAGMTQLQGVYMPATVYYMRPKSFKMVVDVMGKTYIDCTHGDEGWTVNPFMGSAAPQRKSPQDLEMEVNREFENPFIHYKQKGYEVELLGEALVEGMETYQVKLTKEDGREYFYFFDETYFLPVMMRTFIRQGEMEGMPIEVYFSDYEEVGEVVLAYSIEQRLNGQVFMQITADSIILNDPDIRPEMFAFPKDAGADKEKE